MSANQGLLGLSDGRSYYPNVVPLGALIDFRSQYALVPATPCFSWHLWCGSPVSRSCASACSSIIPAPGSGRSRRRSCCRPSPCGLSWRPACGPTSWHWQPFRAFWPGWRWATTGVSHGRGGWGGSSPEPFLWLVWRWRTRPPSASSSGSSRRSRSGCPRRRPSPRTLKETGEEPGCSPLPVQRSACSSSPLSSHRGRSSRSSAATPSAVGSTWAPSSWSWRLCASRAPTSITPRSVIYVAVAVLTAIGLAVAWKNRRTRWLCALWLAFMGVLLGSLVSIPVLTHVASLHYVNSYRVVGTCTLTTAPLLALAMSHLVERAAARLETPPGVEHRHRRRPDRLADDLMLWTLMRSDLHDAGGRPGRGAALQF